MAEHNWPDIPNTVLEGAGYRQCRNEGCEAWGFDHWFDTDGEVQEIGEKTDCPKSHTTDDE